MKKNDNLEKIRFNILSANKVQSLDKAEKGESLEKGYALMKEAGNALFKKIKEKIQKEKTAQGIVYVFVGAGNNGGDGLVVARLLLEQKIPVCVYGMKPSSELKNEAGFAFKDFEKAGGTYELFSEIKMPDLKNATLIVDALLGLGFEGILRSNYQKLVDYLNQSGVPIYSVDCPTIPLQANYTMLMGFARNEIYTEKESVYYGTWEVAPLSYSQKNVEIFSENVYGLIDAEMWRLLPKRNEWGDKRIQGTALIVAGSRGMLGAASLCAKAALRSGIGLLSLAVPASLLPELSVKLDEPVLLPYEDFGSGHLVAENIQEIKKFLKHQKALAIGPGISRHVGIAEVVTSFVSQVSVPMVLDADALNAFEKNLEALKHHSEEVIITPHEREWERLFGALPNSIEKRDQELREKAKEYNLVIILKGGVSCIAFPDGEIYRVGSPNSGMAKGGSGDVLTGILVALLAQGCSAKEAALLGTWLHSEAGKSARNRLGAFSMLPSDVIQELPNVFLKLEKNF